MLLTEVVRGSAYGQQSPEIAATPDTRYNIASLKTVLVHTGRDPGLYTFTYLCQTTGSGAVILTNGQNGNKAVIPLLKSLAAESELVNFLVSAMR